MRARGGQHHALLSRLFPESGGFCTPWGTLVQGSWQQGRMWDRHAMSHITWLVGKLAVSSRDMAMSPWYHTAGKNLPTQLTPWVPLS